MAPNSAVQRLTDTTLWHYRQKPLLNTASRGNSCAQTCSNPTIRNGCMLGQGWHPNDNDIIAGIKTYSSDVPNTPETNPRTRRFCQCQGQLSAFCISARCLCSSRDPGSTRLPDHKCEIYDKKILLP
ncbi:hypothetical protein HZ326_16934 [Fusarium oxysporum f. sp. albedinis]|nr:hypothetical protein HZ326_16934 [Fusarium oxysporum f. sp. albedinis]